MIYPPILSTPMTSLTSLEKSLLAHLIILIQPRVTLELGVCEGLTTEFMCQVLRENRIQGVVVGFDLPEVIEDVRRRNERLVQMEQIGQVLLVPGCLPGSLVAWLHHSDKEIDLAIVDATHDYPSVYGELSLLWPRLSEYGYVICHDYNEKYEGVRWAVDHFVASQPGACVVPIVSSPRAEEIGIRAKVAVLRRRPYHYSGLGRFQLFQLPQIKSRLLSNPVVGVIWKWIKPLLRRDSN